MKTAKLVVFMITIAHFTRWAMLTSSVAQVISSAFSTTETHNFVRALILGASLYVLPYRETVETIVRFFARLVPRMNEDEEFLP